MEDRSPILFWMGISMLALAWLAFCLRIYTRGFLMKTFGLDDWLMGLTVFFFTAYIGCQTAGIVYGTGKHLDQLTPANAKTALLFWWFCEVFYIPCVAFLKLSVGVFLHRVAERPLHLWILRFMMFSTGLFGSIYFFLAIFQCKPIDAWWIRKHDLTYKNYGFCMNNLAVVATSLASAILNSFADWTFGILPIFIVKDLQMPIKQKRLVAAILSLASIACVATIVRMPFILNLAKVDDFLFETVDVALWSNVEPGIGIAAACAATLRPLLKRLRKESSSNGDSSSWNSRGKRRRGRYYHSSDKQSSSENSYALRHNLNLRPDYVGNYTEITAGEVEEGTRGSGSRSDSRNEKKEPLITGRELKDLDSQPDHVRVLTAAPVAPVTGRRQSSSNSYTSSVATTNRQHPNPRQSDRRAGGEMSSAIEIQKSVEFTFIEEVESVEQQAQRHNHDRSFSAGISHGMGAGGGVATVSERNLSRTRSGGRISLSRTRSGSTGLSAYNHFGPSPPAPSPIPRSYSPQLQSFGSGSTIPTSSTYSPNSPMLSPREREPRTRETNSRRWGPPATAGSAAGASGEATRNRSGHPAGAVGDPFASWRP